MSTLENRRFFLIAILGVLLFFTWQAWKKEHPDVRAPAELSQAAPAVASAGDDLVAPAQVAASLAEPGAEVGAESPAANPVAAATTVANPAARVLVTTDKLRVSLSLAGGDLRRVELLDYPHSKKKPDQALALLNDQDPNYFVLLSGLAGTDKPLSTASTGFAATASEFRMAEGVDSLDVPLTHIDPTTGITLTKTWRFTRGSYQVQLLQTLANTGTAPVAAAAYARMQRTPPYAGDEPPFSQTFTGVGFYEQKEDSSDYRFLKVALDDLADEPVERTQTSGWIAMLQQYFLTAIIPPKGEKLSFSAKPSTVKGYLAQYYSPMRTAAPGGSAEYATQFYVGPLLNGTLDDVAPGLALTEDYGILSPIAKPLFWLMKKFYAWVGNWGVAIILLTLTVKALMYKLSEAQFRSMGKMKKFAPRIADIKERYAGDKERLNKAMMELYTKEGFNPLAGCWPLLVQFPVFIALYWVLAQSVELRQADFALWINDLSSPDPFYVLPVLFGISMWGQQKIQGSMATMDPMQQKMMQFMPIALTAFFAFFPAGLVLYWFVSNLITIAQQWYINRKLAAEETQKAETASAAKAAAKAPAKALPGKK